MNISMYQNRCKTCGTVIVTTQKAVECEACGSDELECTRQAKPFDIKSLIAKILIGSLAAAGVLALILM